LGVASVYALLRSGEMPSIKVGKKYFVPQSALLKWLENCGASNKLTA
jgi:excisionase family DNA binding protein